MVDPGERPGGLTVLAVLNFIIGGYRVLCGLSTAAVFGLMKDELEKKAAQAREDLPEPAALYTLLLFGLVEAGFLIASGVGYLGLKRFLGKMLGNAYALLALAGAAVSIYVFDRFEIATMISLVYPVVTVALLNTVFKDDFLNP